MIDTIDKLNHLERSLIEKFKWNRACISLNINFTIGLSALVKACDRPPATTALSNTSVP